jgi:hypothetical protein
MCIINDCILEDFYDEIHNFRTQSENIVHFFNILLISPTREKSKRLPLKVIYILLNRPRQKCEQKKHSIHVCTTYPAAPNEFFLPAPKNYIGKFSEN